MTFLGDLILRLLKLGLVDHSPESRLTPAGVELYETRLQRHGLITGAPAFARLQPVHVVSGNPGTPGNFFHGQLARRPTIINPTSSFMDGAPRLGCGRVGVIRRDPAIQPEAPASRTGQKPG